MTEEELKQVQEQLTSLVIEALKKLLGTEGAMLDSYLPQIGEALVAAITSGDTAQRDELLHQLEALAELGRLKANNDALALLKEASAIILDVAVDVAALFINKYTGGLVK